MKTFWLILTGGLLCSMSPILAQTSNPPATATVSTVEPAQPAIAWDTNTLVLIQPQGHYARILRLRNGQLACGYDYLGKIWVRLSANEGHTWQPARLVADWEFGRLTNTELLELADGTLLCFYNQRPTAPARETPDDAPREKPFAICLARSTDQGHTWSPTITIYTGGREWGNGCWEPSALQLPSGEIQVCFANEAPYRHSNEQEITLLRSTNNAAAWSAPERLSFRSGHRDGMPVPLVLSGGKDLVVAIEDNGLNGDFKPVLIHTTSGNNWHAGAVLADSPDRWGALSQPLPASVYAGAPYLRQMPGGEVILSFQISASGGVRTAIMAVAIGNALAQQFGPLSYPFPREPGHNQLWNSLFVKNAATITAVSETTIGGISGIWSIDGHFHAQDVPTDKIVK